MSRARVLLVNPTMTARRHARFPLSLLALAERLSKTHAVTLIDGNVDRDALPRIRSALSAGPHAAVGVTVMGGPQVATAIDASQLVRQIAPTTPVVWGGYFPSLYPDTALNASYVDYAVRGPGEETMAELLAALDGPRAGVLGAIAGLSYRADGCVVHNPDRPVTKPVASTIASHSLLGDPNRYLARTVLGARTVAHQGAVGCRFRCTFCGVAAMFRGTTHLPSAALLERDLEQLKRRYGADSVQFYDHNFFDREQDMLPLLEVLARAALPWWCYARADALIDLSPEAWSLVRRSRLKMAYIGAESPNDRLLREIRKGTRADQTLEVAELCRRHGVIPELSFMVAPPVDPEGETERTFEFIREVKRVNPAAEIIVYVYTPLPTGSLPERLRARVAAPPGGDGRPLRFPATPEEWTERRWVDYACHADAPWLSDRLRRRIRDFVTVLNCRFPTVQDVRTPGWAAGVLRAGAAWRYRLRRYDRPWELDLARRVIRLAEPQATSL